MAQEGTGCSTAIGRNIRRYALLAVIAWSLVFAASLDHLAGLQQGGAIYLGTGTLWFAGIAGILVLGEGARRRHLEKRASEQELRRAAAVFSSSHEGIVIAALDGRVQAVNPAFTAITGYREAEIRGHRLNLLQSGRHDETFYQSMWQAIVENGFWQGEIWNRRKDGDIYPEWLTISAVRDDSGRVSNYVGVFSDISIIKRSQDQLEYLAYHDPLTGLPNRAMLRDRIEHAVERLHRNGGRGAVLFLDLDHFKAVNDSYGHPVGDQVLKAVSERLRSRLREGDTLARLGGDEFVVLLEDVQAPEDVAIVAEDLIALFRKVFPLSDECHVSLGLSVGICLFPDDARQTDDVLQFADVALYQAKQGGRNTYRFYTESLTLAARHKLALESSLSLALERDEFVLHYQPLVRLHDQRIIGVEALVRWISPEHGLVPTNDFIPLAEETGQIVPLGEWVLTTACRQMRAWLDAGCEIETLAVNLSAVQFRHPGLLDSVRRALEESDLPPRYLELDITETCLMDPLPSVEQRLQGLKALGVRLAIDDFGTGYSSLSYLCRFSVDRLKIDQRFVSGLESGEQCESLVSTIVSLARNLQLQVLAEGIETGEQLDYFGGLGCDAGQGFLFAHPVPGEQLPALLAQTASEPG